MIVYLENLTGYSSQLLELIRQLSKVDGSNVEKNVSNPQVITN